MKGNMNRIKYVFLSMGLALIVTGVLLLITYTYLQSQNDGSLPHDNSIDWLYHSNDKNIKSVPNTSVPSISNPVIGFYEYRIRRV